MAKSYQSLKDVREQRGFTQSELAEKLGIHQKNISNFENRTDLKISTLHDYIDALGGELVIGAKFPGQDMRVIHSLSGGDASV